METNNIKLQLSDFAKNLGADVVGFCQLDKPSGYAPDLGYAVSIAVKLSSAVLSGITCAPTHAYFQHYRTANALLDQIAFRLTQQLEKLCYNAFPVASSQSMGKGREYEGVISHKTVAVLSGLGFVGKSGLFISTEHGSLVRLATVLTDCPLPSDLPVVKNGCGSCNACKMACPAGAIFGELPQTNGQRNYDPEKCSAFMKQHFQSIGRGSVCGVCIKVCPYNFKQS